MKEKHALSLAVLLILCTVALGQSQPVGTEAVLEYRRDHLSLNGTWERLIGHTDQKVWEAKVFEEFPDWRQVEIPSSRLAPELDDHRGRAHMKVNGIWVRRDFTLSAEQAKKNAVLNWYGIRFGAAAYINGNQVTSHPTMGPHTALLPTGTLKEGKNRILLKVTGWNAVPLSKSKRPLIPIGSGRSWGPRSAAVYDEVYLDFYDRVYLKWILAIPDVNREKVTFRVWAEGLDEPAKTLELTATVRYAKNPNAPALTGKLTASDLTAPVDVTVSIPDAKLWSPETPHLYIAKLQGRADGKLCDDVQFRFGMREIRVKDGHYRLNNKPLWFRGSNVLKEYLWNDKFVTQAKRYLVDEARVMNLNCFRTHTQPPCTAWANVTDEGGTMFFAETPVLYNYAKFNFTPEEYKTYHENVLLDARGWITKLWNHPSIVMWVLSNESRYDNVWETTKYRDAVLKLDPTRPTMRTGERGEPAGTLENLDLHPTENFARGPEGWLIKVCKAAAAVKDPTRTLTNTEYMNAFKGRDRMCMLWLGEPNHPDYERVFAECAAEHTEAMRRLDFDAILPYMYAGWTGLRSGRQWRKEFPTPMAAALHSSMAPVLASLDLFDSNFAAGRKVSTPLHLINELHDDVEAKIDAYLTPLDPLCVPDENALKRAVWRESFTRKLPADSHAQESFKWRVPEKPGVYYLAVVLTRDGDLPVVSQRMVRSLAKPEAKKALEGKRIIALDAGDEVARWARSNGAKYSTDVGEKVQADIVIVGDASELSKAQLGKAPAILDFVRLGGKLIILNPATWEWKELLAFEIDRKRTWLTGISSRVFPYHDLDHPILEGLSPESLKRWNGIPGTISDGSIKGDILKKGKKLLWMEKPERCVALSVPLGKGEIVIALLHVRGRINSDSATYDPAAERILVNLLSVGSGPAPASRPGAQ